MKILKERQNILINYEVYKFLETKSNKDNENLNTIKYEVKKYLSNTNCIYQDQEQITNLLIKLKKFNLTKFEKLQLINLRPDGLKSENAIIKIYSVIYYKLFQIIEECEERFNEDQLLEILDIINNCLPLKNNV